MERTAYYLGCFAARVKLGTAAGAVEYAPRSVPDSFPEDTPTNTDNMIQEQQLHSRREPAAFVQAAKTANQSDAGYAHFTSGIYGAGSRDANQHRVDRDQRNQSDIQAAFDTNRNLDQSFGPEPATTQPHGSEKAASLATVLGKLAAAASTFGVGGGLRSGGMGGSKSLMGGLNSTPTLSAPAPMNMHLDSRADKPPGMNLQHGIQTNSGAYDMSSSAGSAIRRFGGNPM